MDILTWLTNWFIKNCDGNWEHNNCISISTLDNPGWCFKVDLSDTVCAGKVLSLQQFTNDEDWYDAKSDGTTFEAFGDPLKLMKLISIFRDFVESTH